jgi:ribonuclease D
LSDDHLVDALVNDLSVRIGHGFNLKPSDFIGKKILHLTQEIAKVELNQLIFKTVATEMDWPAIEMLDIEPRPQEKWKAEVDNDRYTGFKPKIRSKPHAKVPLDSVFSETVSLNTSTRWYPHPYQFELENFTVPDYLLRSKKIIPYENLESTPLHWINTTELLNKMIEKLKQVKEIAVDVEHHSYRSFLGFTCLIQISTRKEDFLIDTIELRSELHQLNEIFCNPDVVKVFHGADRDVEWLQADFGVYVINMFDTGQAARILEFPKYSLAYLLEKYCNIIVDKKYQLADWRVRPLPVYLQKYAREDTHYLLWVYDQLRCELLKSSDGPNMIHTVWMRSRDICLKEYQKEFFDPMGWYQLYERFAITGVGLDSKQLNVFSAIYNWRDKEAREHDESTRYVLPNDLLWELSLKMPTDQTSFLACCKPVPPLIKDKTEDLIKIIGQAKENKYHDPSEDIAYSKQVKYNKSAPHNSHSLLQNKSLTASPDCKRLLNSLLLRDVPSPVLSTDQLYKHAQWTEERSDSHQSLMPSQRAVDAKMKEDIYLRSQLPYDFYDSNEIDMDFEDEYGNDDLTIDAKSRRKTAAALCNAYANDNVLDISEISSESEEDDNEEEELEGLESIPTSMDEIYKLSNKTRKQKKNKKKIKRKLSSTSPKSPLLLKQGYGEAPIDIRSQKACPDLDSQNEYQPIVDFMKTICWIESDEMPPKPVVKQQEFTNSTTTSTTNGSLSRSASNNSLNTSTNSLNFSGTTIPVRFNQSLSNSTNALPPPKKKLTYESDSDGSRNNSKLRQRPPEIIAPVSTYAKPVSNQFNYSHNSRDNSYANNSNGTYSRYNNNNTRGGGAPRRGGGRGNPPPNNNNNSYQSKRVSTSTSGEHNRPRHYNNHNGQLQTIVDTR